MTKSKFYLISVVFVLLIINIGCSEPKEKSVQIKYKNGQLHQSYNLIKNANNNFVLNDKYFEYYENGNKKVIGSYDPQFSDEKDINGVNIIYKNADSIVAPKKGRKGDWFWWYSNGNIMCQAAYKNGKKHGLISYWYDNGQKKDETFYKDGKKDSVSVFWYRNGIKQQECFYEDSLLNGVFTQWYENGALKNKGYYKTGLEDGLSTYWYENGQKKQECFFTDSLIIGEFNQWHENGVNKFQGYYALGKKNGMFINWNESGIKIQEFHFNAGLLEGRFTLWNEKNIKTQECYYKDDLLEGEFSQWFDNGKIKLKGFYKNGMKDGLFKSWNTNGIIDGEYMFAQGESSENLLQQELLPFQDLLTGKYGYMNEFGEVLITPRFTYNNRSHISKFYDGIAMIVDYNSLSNDCYYIDTKGKVIYKYPEYSFLYDFSCGYGLVKSTKGAFFVNKNGIVVSPIYQNGKPFSDNKTIVTINNKNYVINTNFQILFELQVISYNNLGDFNDGLLPIKNVKNEWGYLDSAGKLVIKPQFWFADEFSGQFKNGFAYVGRNSIINKKGEIIYNVKKSRGWDFPSRHVIITKNKIVYNPDRNELIFIDLKDMSMKKIEIPGDGGFENCRDIGPKILGDYIFYYGSAFDLDGNLVWKLKKYNGIEDIYYDKYILVIEKNYDDLHLYKYDGSEIKFPGYSH